MVDKYIKELLIEHGRVYIPNLGLIYKDYKNNDYPSDPYTLEYPKSLYLIDEEYTSEDDTWLAYAIARGEHGTLEEAENLLKERVDNIKYALKDGNSTQIDGLGTIENNSGKLYFIINSEFINQESDDNFGIPSQLAIDSEEPESSSYEENSVSSYEDSYREPEDDPIYENDDLYTNNLNRTTYKQERSGSSKFAIVAAIVLIIAAGSVLIYILYFMPAEDNEMAENQKETKTEQLADTTQVAEASLGGDSMDAPASGSAIPLSVPEKGKRYYIIAGAFTVNENAQKLRRQFKSKGIKAKIIESKDSQGLYRVSLADFDNFAQALSTTHDLRNKHGNSIWILKY